VPINTLGTNWLIVSSSLSGKAREDERDKQDATSRSQGDNRNEQILLLSLEVVELLAIRIRGVRVIAVRNRKPNVRSLDTLGGEELWTIRIDFANGVVALGVDTVNEEVGDDVQGASRLLGNTQMAVTVLLDEGSTVTQIASNHRGIGEGSGRISLVSNDDDRVLQFAVPWASEPFDSTNRPSVAVVARLGELDTKHRGNILDDTDEFIKDGLCGDVVLINGITAGNGVECVIREILGGLPL